MIDIASHTTSQSQSPTHMSTNLHEIDENMARLIAAHPLLFRGEAPAVPSFLPTGWYALVDKLCSDIETELGLLGCGQFEVRQVKEKFGTLSFYYRFQQESDLHVEVVSAAGVEQYVRRTTVAGADQLRVLIEQAEAVSASTCQRCGEAGSMRNLGGWRVTLCEQHYADRLDNGDRKASVTT